MFHRIHSDYNSEHFFTARLLPSLLHRRSFGSSRNLEERLRDEPKEHLRKRLGIPGPQYFVRLREQFAGTHLNFV